MEETKEEEKSFPEDNLSDDEEKLAEAMKDEEVSKTVNEVTNLLKHN